MDCGLWMVDGVGIVISAICGALGVMMARLANELVHQRHLAAADGPRMDCGRMWSHLAGAKMIHDRLVRNFIDEAPTLTFH